MKPFAFINSIDEDSINKNQRILDQGTKSGTFTPTFTNVTNVSAASRGYYALTGPLCYYYILAIWDGVGAGIGTGAGPAPSYVNSIPYGPTSVSGIKTSWENMFMECVNYAAGSELVPGYKGILGYNAGIPRIMIAYNLAPTVSPGNSIAIYGTFFRE